MTIPKILIVTALAAVLATIALYYRSNAVSSQKIYSSLETQQILNEVYYDLSGFCISDEERAGIDAAGGNATYGEITFDSVEELIKFFSAHLTAQDLFFDLGSGIGKACAHVALRTPAQVKGIELSSTRYGCAQRVKEELLKKNILTDKNKLQFIEQNILDADLSNASVIFMCSTCFSDELMNKMVQKINAIPKPVHIASLKQLPSLEGTRIIPGPVLNLPMTWSSSSSVYTYELE